MIVDFIHGRRGLGGRTLRRRERQKFLRQEFRGARRALHLFPQQFIRRFNHLAALTFKFDHGVFSVGFGCHISEGIWQNNQAV